MDKHIIMETKGTRETLENIVIGDGATSPQYMIHRIPENAQLLSSDLLQQHNGLVVDLGGTDFIPVSYTSEDLLSQDLTEEDRNLAAALVAVQLSQQQKQQQLQDATLPTLVSNSALGMFNIYERIYNKSYYFFKVNTNFQIHILHMYYF